jgi:hypothetical protein
MSSVPGGPTAPRPLELLLVMAAATAFALLLYYLPQAGIAIHSDVSWIYRLQVADPAEIGPVPYGLEAFSGAPMNLAEACAAHYAAFGRLNCLDIASFRAIAAVAGGDTDLWLLIYLATGLAMAGLLYWLMRRLGLPVALAALLLAGALVAPQELWLGYRTSEPRNAVALLLGLAALLTLPARWRNPAAALAMAVAVQLKEPMVAYWPLVWLVALGVEAREAGGLGGLKDRRRVWRATWPHLLAGALVGVYMAAITQLVENRFSYAFLATGGYPDLGQFLDRYWNGLVPALLEGQFLAALGLLLAVLVAAVAPHAERRQAALTGWRDPVILATLLGALLAIVAHGAFYYATRRLIGDTRYVNPANVAMLLLFAAALAPLARAAGATAAKLAVLAALAAVGWYVLTVQARDPASDALVAVLGLATALALFLATLALTGGGPARRLRPALLNAAVAGLLVLALGPYMRQSLNAAAQTRADMRSWAAAQATVAQAPENATIRLATDTPLMIETSWGLQTEMLFAGRGDLNFRMEPLDTSFYEQESGLVRAAVEAFNAERPAPRPDKDYTLLMDRGGRGGDPNPDARSTGAWAGLLLSDPQGFFRAAYLEGRTGYLRFSWETPPGS